MDQVGPDEPDRPHPPVPRRQGAGRLRREAPRDLRHGLARRGALRHEHAPPDRAPRHRRRRQGRRAQGPLQGPRRPPATNDFNDHIVSGLQIGIDGYLYISVGDKGVPKATGPDGRTAQVVGGGILRCRPDGTGLEVFSTGTRNHLEPNLDDRDNLFTYDNTDDGLGWWTRVTHHIDGGYYGYPYDYHNRPTGCSPGWPSTAAAPPAAASSTARTSGPRSTAARLLGRVGQGQVQAFRFAPEGATFKVAEMIDFVEPGDVENFRPLDLALSHDGRTLYVADWSMGGWGNKTEKLGRVYAVTYTGGVKTRPRGKDSDPIEAQIEQLDHPSFNERMRAQAALIARGRGRAGRRRRPPWPTPGPTRSPAAPGLGARRRSPAARPRRPSR